MVGYSLASVHAASIGVMMEPIERDLGWSRTQIYSGASLVSFVAMGLATFAGAGIDRFGARRIGIATVVLMCLAIALLSTTGDSLWGWWARWVLVGIAISAMPTVWIAAVAGSFNASRGLAISVALSGSGIGMFLAPIIANALAMEYGWRGGFVGLAAIWGAVTLPLVLLFFHGPKPAPRSTARDAASSEAAALPGLTAREAFRSPTFYKLLFAGAATTLGGVAIILNLVPVLTSLGVDRTNAATLAGLSGIATIVGRVTGGWLLDLVSAKWIAAVASAIAIILPVLLLLFPGSVAAATIGIVIYGMMSGAMIGALVYLASRHFGQRAFGTLYGAINASIAFVVALAPLAANFIYDLTSSYEPVMWAAVPVLIAAGLLYASLGTYPEFARETKTG